MFKKRPFQTYTRLTLLVLLILLLYGCTITGEKESEAAAAVTQTPYQISLRAKGFVELVGADQAAAELPPNPSQADLGAEPYRQICLACHGDWGQGLTEEWRSTWDEDKNCWQSKCHASNHPPWGFEFPQSVPAVLGPDALHRFSTAASLYENIQNTMPWWNPGSLTTEDAWAITAYLMRERGEFGDDAELNTGNAAVYRLHTPYVANNPNMTGIITLIGFLTLALIGLVKN